MLTLPAVLLDTWYILAKVDRLACFSKAKLAMASHVKTKSVLLRPLPRMHTRRPKVFLRETLPAGVRSRLTSML